ncbi:MAG: ferritin-like domain-containing protein [Thiohalocapsa sp.]
MTQAPLLRSLLACFAECEPTRKVEQTCAAAAGFLNAEQPLDVLHTEALSPSQPGRPVRPELVAPRHLPRRGLQHAEGRAALIHAVAHIEFNAINLALDAVLRFPGMPSDYYADWIRVADEEAYHFSLMRERLRGLGYDYGYFRAHDGLWEMARQTAGDLLERMALVPRVLEARGLDVTPGMIERLQAVGDEDTADRLRIILRDEVGHVAIGSRWFRWLCEQRGLEPRSTYLKLIRERFRGAVRCPLNLTDRRLAGFDEAELDGLMAMCVGPERQTSRSPRNNDAPA